jgi:tetratricopeptide (TPR) repeat protein
MLDAYFKLDDFDKAVPYAQTLIERAGAAEAAVPNRADYLLGAHFVLARVALGATPPRPEEALEQVRLAEQLRQQQKGDVPPRWRMIGLEAVALKMQADAGRDNPRSLQRLREERLPGWLARLRKETTEVVPASGDHPAHPFLADLSPSDTRGLLATVLVIVELNGGGPDLPTCVDLALTALEQMASEDATYLQLHAEVARSLPRLTAAVFAHAGAGPQPEAHWPQVVERLAGLLARSRAAGDAVSPRSYLDLCRYCREENRLDQALQFARAGLESATARPSSPEGHEVPELHAEAARLLLLQGNSLSAEEHLVPLFIDKTLAGVAHLMGGLAAVQNGRMERGISELKLALQSGSPRNNLPACLGLAQAYMALGKYDEALAQLLKIRTLVDKVDQLTEEDRKLVGTLLPDPAGLGLELFRCYLALGRMEEAREWKEKLRDTPRGPAAAALLVNARVRQAVARQQDNPEAARAEFAAARAELAMARRLYPDDARLVLVEAGLLVSQPEINRPLVACAAWSLLAPTDLGALLAANLRLRQGLEWHLARAEAVVRQHAWGRAKRDLPGLLAWVRWLQMRGRLDEAATLLARLAEVEYPEHRRHLQFLRARLLLAGGRAAEVGPLVRDLELAKSDLDTDLLNVLYLAGLADGAQEARKKLDVALSRHESAGLLHYWHAQLAQARGDYRAATEAYGQSLAFTAFKGPSRAGLLASLSALNRQAPQESRELAMRLLQANPGDPALLLALVEANLLLGQLGGSEGVAGTLMALEAALKQEKKDPELAPYFRARAWLAAGRPDLGLGEIRRALALNPRHVPTLELAAQTTAALGEWGGVQEAADALAAVQTDLSEVLRWRGLALEKQGKHEEASQSYRDLVRRYPNLPAGYLGMARLLEKAGKVVEGLAWVERCRQRCPDDIQTCQTRVQFLCWCHKEDEAATAAEQMLRDLLGRLRQEQAKALKERPPSDEAERERRVTADRDALAERELTLDHAFAGAFLEAGAYDLADRWLGQYRDQVGRLPEAKRPATESRGHLLLGDLRLVQGRREPDPERRRRLMAQAIDAYTAAHRLAPEDLTAVNNLAWALNHERRTGEAYAYAQELRKGRLSQQPLTGDRLPLPILDTLAEVFSAAGHPEEAVSMLEEAAVRYPREPQVYLQLGRAHLRLKNYSKAGEALARARQFAEGRAANAPDAEEERLWQRLAAEADDAKRELPRLAP